MLIDDFLKYLQIELNKSAHTVESYRHDLRQWAEFETQGQVEELRRMEATSADIRLYMSHLASTGHSAATIRRKASALRGFFRYLVRFKGLEGNPLAALRLARPAKRLPQVIAPAQMQRVLDEGGDEDSPFLALRNSLIMEMLYQTGLRSSELTGLLDANVDSRSGRIKVLGKRAKERYVPIGPGLCSMIDDYRAARAGYCGEGGEPFGAFFVKKTGEPIKYRMLNYIVHRHLDGKVNSARRSPHVIRHSFATDMLSAGADLNAVKTLLGHESLDTTQIYTHISISELQHNYQLAHPRAQKKEDNHGNQNPSNPL